MIISKTKFFNVWSVSQDLLFFYHQFQYRLPLKQKDWQLKYCNIQFPENLCGISISALQKEAKQDLMKQEKNNLSSMLLFKNLLTIEDCLNSFKELNLWRIKQW